MSSELASATAVTRRRSLALEILLVIVVSLAVLVPGIWKYSLVDPWETHYGEVARMMLQEHDFVHTQWPGGTTPDENEGFRSKPVLIFWAMAASMRATGMAKDGGYSGEMVATGKTMVAIRLPFILFAVFGLVMMWWMLARLINRRLAWLALLVVLSCPFYALVARQAIPDMPLTALVMGAFAMFAMAVEDGDRPIDVVHETTLGKRKVRFDHLHLFLLLAGAIVGIQAIYYAIYFALSPRIAILHFPNPAVFFPVFMGLLFGALSRDGWLVLRLPFVLLGGAISGARRRPLPEGAANRSWWRVVVDDFLVPWEREAPDRYIVRGLLFPIAWSAGRPFRDTDDWADHVLGMKPITSMRQIYLLWCYVFLGVSLLAKGPPGLAVIGAVGVLYVVLAGKWRDLWEGRFEIKRGLLLMIVVAVPWHLGMWLKEGARFIDEYLLTHILNRAAVGVDNSPGTFEYYSSQIGHGMWLWAALLPAAVGAALLRARTDDRESRVRFLIGLWAIGGVAFFSIVQTKFHHYILPAVPGLALLVAFFLEDMWRGAERLHRLYALLAIAIILLVTRDLMWEPERWIEMFVYRYDRPWPTIEPWAIDPSDGFFAVGILAVVAVAVARFFRRAGVIALLAAGLAICLWSLHGYMPDAGKHWGMREAMRTYYQQRTIYGEKRVYFGARQLYDHLADAGDKWTFETFIPDNLQIGQPMTIEIQLNNVEHTDVIERDVAMVGNVTHIGDHEIEVTLMPGERAKLDPLLALGKNSKARGRPPVRIVDADRLMAWQLYWRGENFWSQEEIFGPVPEMRTGFNKAENTDMLKYLNDRSRAPLGRRYFVVTEAGRATGPRGVLPTKRAQDTYEVLDTTSNKFSLAAFYL
jgi:4-amino-4-deoxy-L-arabinose transferase-like glycosyltransferase